MAGLKDPWWLAKKAVGVWPLLRPDTNLRSLNLTNEKNIASQKSFVSTILSKGVGYYHIR
jgi:hypothetical protein